MREFSDLFEAVESGDAQAWEEFHRRYEPRVNEMAHFRLGPKLRPQWETLDLTSEFFLEFYRGLSSSNWEFENESDFLGFAKRVIFNVVAKWNRAANTAKRDGGHLVSLDDDSGSPSAQDFGASPSKELIARETQTAILDAIDGIDREILDRRSRGDTFETIGDALELSKDAVRMRHKRLLENLEKRFPNFRKFISGD